MIIGADLGIENSDGAIDLSTLSWSGLSHIFDGVVNAFAVSSLNALPSRERLSGSSPCSVSGQQPSHEADLAFFGRPNFKNDRPFAKENLLEGMVSTPVTQTCLCFDIFWNSFFALFLSLILRLNLLPALRCWGNRTVEPVSGFCERTWCLRYPSVRPPREDVVVWSDEGIWVLEWSGHEGVFEASNSRNKLLVNTFLQGSIQQRCWS